MMKPTAKVAASASTARFKVRDARMKSKTAPWVTSVAETRVMPCYTANLNAVVIETTKVGAIDEMIATAIEIETTVDATKAATENVRARVQEIEKIERRIAEDVRARVIVDRNTDTINSTVAARQNLKH